MEKNGINERTLSHTQRMENQTQQNEVLTKANKPQETVKGVVLSEKELDEYRNYQRRKRIDEIMAAMAKSGSALTGISEIQKTCERAKSLKQASLQLPFSALAQAKRCLYEEKRYSSKQKITRVQDLRLFRKTAQKTKIFLDCLIGGTGETVLSVKMYEARRALKNGAKELTLILTPSFIVNGRYGEIRKELRRFSHISKKATLKVFVDNVYPIAVLGRIARIVSEVGLQYFCVPYFDGCERIRFDLINGCKLQISNVQTLTDFRRMVISGAGRIVTEHAWDIYEEWMQEVDKMEFAKPALLVRETEEKEEHFSEKDVPTVEAPKKQPLPLSKVLQSGLPESTAEEKSENANPDLKIL